MSLWAELRRRNVIRVAVLYVVVAWLLMQVADVGMSTLELPDWTGKLVLFLLALGFPVVLIFSWIYEFTPEGIKRESEVDRSSSVTHQTGQRLNVVIAVLLVVAIGAVVADRLFPEAPAPAQPVAGTSDAADGAPGTRTTAEHAAETAAIPEPVLAPAAESSIAVLPFVDMSPGKDNEYFSDGLTEELLNSLAKIRALKVAGRTSSFAYKGKDEDLRVIGEELGVANILEGSVRKAGDRLRITAQLINAKDGYHVWSETYDRELTDVFAIQTDIAEHVAESLKVTLLGEDADRMEAGGTDNIEAYNDYLRGVYLVNQGSREQTTRQAVAAFESALAKDPGYANAWTSLGLAMTNMIANGWGSLEENWVRLEEAAKQAQRLAPELGGGYLLESSVLAYREFRWDEAVNAIRHAVELEPGNATIVTSLALVLRNVAVGDDVIDAARRGVELEPTNLSNQVYLGGANMLSARCDDARAVLQNVLERDPTFPRARYYMGVCQYLNGDYEGALELFSEEPLAWMRTTGRPLALYKLGRMQEARMARRDLDELYQTTASYQRAQVAAQWGETDEAFQALATAFETRDVGVTTMLTDPLMQPLYDDPRYLAALERAGLKPFLEEVRAGQARAGVQ